MCRALITLAFLLLPIVAFAQSEDTKSDEKSKLAHEYFKAGKVMKRLHSKRHVKKVAAQDDAMKAIKAVQDRLTKIKAQSTIGVPDIDDVEKLLSEATQKLIANGCLAD